MIDEIVGICCELKLSSFIDREILLEGKVPVLEARTVNAVADALLQIEGACCRLRKERRTTGGGGCEVLVVLLSRIPRKLLENPRTSVHDPELPLRCIGAASEAANLANAGVVVVSSYAAGLPRLEL